VNEPLHISICIASYGNDVSLLLANLHAQIENIESAIFDIHVSDQFAQAHPNATNWQQLPSTHYHHNTHNKGRAANRNFLGAIADGTQLLFLDADALPVRSDFLIQYIEAASENSVIVGGTAYERTSEPHLLRQMVGRKKEQVPAHKRNSRPYSSFTAFNALIPSAVFARIPFDENLKEYGHEDTLFGLELRHHVIPIRHIDNPAFHLGLDEDLEFMKKTRQAVDTLASLIEQGKIDEEVRLFEVYMKWSKLGGHIVLRSLYGLIGQAIFENLSSGRGNVLLFDLYKLLRISHQKPKVGRKMP
jgi:hypothetical protein